MKRLIFIFLCIAAVSAHGQTAKELIGKWKLVKLTKNGEVQDIVSTYKTDQVYQIFMDDNVFQGVVGDNTRKGKWKLSDDNKELIIKISIVKVKFSIDYFDANKRIISSDQTGTLEYEKVGN